MPFLPAGALAGLGQGIADVTREAYEQNQIAQMKQQMGFAQFWQDASQRAYQQQQEQQDLLTQEAGPDWQQFVDSRNQPPQAPQVQAPPPSPQAMAAFGPQGGQGGGPTPAPPAPQPPMPGQPSAPTVMGPQGKPAGVPGWMNSPSAPTWLGGPPSGPPAASQAPQVQAPPPQTPTLDQVALKPQYASAADFASYLTKTYPNMSAEHRFKLVQASQVVRDKYNQEVLDQMNIEVKAQQAGKAAADAVRSQAQADRLAHGSTEEKDTANEREAIVASGGDPHKSLGEQTADVQARVAEFLRKKEDKQTSIHVSIGAQGLGQSSIPEKDQDKHGEAYLKTLTPARAAEVKGLAEGRMQIQNLGYRGQQRQQMLEMVAQYDPEFDLTQAPARAATRRDFASGQAARNITAINTAIGHIGTMKELADALGNNDIQRVNQLVNTVKQETGNPNVNSYNLAKTAVSDEMMRVFRQVGASEQEASRWADTFNAANSPAKMKAAMQTAAKLLDSRIEALGDQWSRTMGTVPPPEIVSKRSQAVLKSLGVKTGGGGNGADSDTIKQADAIVGGG